MAEKYIAVIGDLVRSKKLPSRAKVQTKLEGALHELNSFENVIESQFTPTLGDEFQGLLTGPQPLCDILLRFENQVGVQLRVGIGYGVLSTPPKKKAIGSDGPCWHAARAAIGSAHKLGTVDIAHKGFGDDALLDVLARLLRSMIRGMTPKQYDAMALYWEEQRVASIADLLQVTAPTASVLLQRANARQVRDGLLKYEQLIDKRTRNER